jgi:hypothetical protein
VSSLFGGHDGAQFSRSGGRTFSRCGWCGGGFTQIGGDGGPHGSLEILWRLGSRFAFVGSFRSRDSASVEIPLSQVQEVVVKG